MNAAAETLHTDTAAEFDPIGTATYSPDDNKLRIYPFARLDRETYDRVRAAGFGWAPKQELFVAPAWTPGRADLALELCGEIGDEDTSLVARAEDRADRFDEYAGKRAQEATRARDAVSAIADNIPLGQPILVGHHSERRARKDAERIQNGMRRAVQLWETSGYWKERAAGALANAKYKERPDVRARRIKKIEADQRKWQRAKDEAHKAFRMWTTPGLSIEHARILSGSVGRMTVCAKEGSDYGWSAWDVLQPDDKRFQSCPSWTVEQVVAVAQRVYPRSIARYDRWIEHYEMRLSYERAMLGETGYTEPPKRATSAVLPLLNYPGAVKVRSPYTRDNSVETYESHPMTAAAYAAINRDYKGTRVSADGTHRVRCAIISTGGRRALGAVFLTDSKQHTPPGAAEPATREAEETALRIQRAQERKERMTKARAEVTARNAAIVRGADEKPAQAAAPAADESKSFDALRDSLRAGVQVVSAPQLFPTPPELANRMVLLADIEPGHRVLEPSAGTGNLISAIHDTEMRAQVVGVEISPALFGALSTRFPDACLICGDFLRITSETATPAGEVVGMFDRIVMNPPFAGAADIEHIRHAMGFLRPGGRLVAICAGGPRQAAALQRIAEDSGGIWEPLPAGTFNESGTGVNTVLLVIEA